MSSTSLHRLLPSYNLSRLTFAFMLLLSQILVAGWLPVSLYAAPNPTIVQLPGLIPVAEIRKAQALGNINTSDMISLVFVLPIHNEAALDDLLSRLYDPMDPMYGNYLTPSEFIDRFGPTQAEYDAVTTFAKWHGLSITATHNNRILLDVRGSAGTVEEVFGTKLLRYRSATGREFHAPSVNPAIPVSLRGHLLSIVGLDNATLRHPYNRPLTINDNQSATSGIGSGPYGGLTPSDISRAYGLGGSYLTGFGQSLGLFELDGYNKSDISQYAAAYGLPNVPLHNVLVDGFDGTSKSVDGSAEVTLDIELQMALAPNVDQIIVYEGPNTDVGILDTYNRMADDNIAKMISTSWGSPEDKTNQFLISAEDSIFRQMAAQGQTVCAASGDNGAYDDKQSLERVEKV